MKNVYILGATGSIGTQTLDVIRKDRANFSVIGLSLGREKDFVNESIIKEFLPEIVVFRDDKLISEYEKKFPNIIFKSGDSGLLDIAKYPKKGILVNALVGAVGLLPTIYAIESKKDIGIANKETLVIAGDIINKLVKKHNIKLLPVDSEHSALWQLIDNEKKENIKKIVITASGGSFRNKARKELENVSLKDALNHPNWNMGNKITIDSATMMNKGFEVIEAHYLFDIEYEKIETIIHKESIVHGLVYYNDGTIKASLGISDMKIPISYALYYPNRNNTYDKELELTDLSFSKMDFNRYPLLKLAYDAGIASTTKRVVMNAANEVAVKLFLEERISFLDIEKIVIEKTNEADNKNELTIDEIIKIDQDTKTELLNKFRG